MMIVPEMEILAGNHELYPDTYEECHLFEGVEKTLEICVQSASGYSLRNLSRAQLVITQFRLRNVTLTIGCFMLSSKLLYY